MGPENIENASAMHCDVNHSWRRSESEKWCAMKPFKQVIKKKVFVRLSIFASRRFNSRHCRFVSLFFISPRATCLFFASYGKLATHNSLIQIENFATFFQLFVWSAVENRSVQEK